MSKLIAVILFISVVSFAGPAPIKKATEQSAAPPKTSVEPKKAVQVGTVPVVTKGGTLSQVNDNRDLFSKKLVELEKLIEKEAGDVIKDYVDLDYLNWLEREKIINMDMGEDKKGKIGSVKDLLFGSSDQSKAKQTGAKDVQVQAKQIQAPPSFATDTKIKIEQLLTESWQMAVDMSKNKTAMSDKDSKKLIEILFFLNMTHAFTNEIDIPLHTEISNLKYDPECVGDLLGDRLIYRYAKRAVFEDYPVALTILTQIATQFTCMSEWQVALTDYYLNYAYDAALSNAKSAGVGGIIRQDVAGILFNLFAMSFDMNKHHYSLVFERFKEEGPYIINAYNPGNFLYNFGIWLIDPPSGGVSEYKFKTGGGDASIAGKNAPVTQDELDPKNQTLFGASIKDIVGTFCSPESLESLQKQVDDGQKISVGEFMDKITNPNFLGFGLQGFGGTTAFGVPDLAGICGGGGGGGGGSSGGGGGVTCAGPAKGGGKATTCQPAMGTLPGGCLACGEGMESAGMTKALNSKEFFAKTMKVGTSCGNSISEGNPEGEPVEKPVKPPKTDAEKKLDEAKEKAKKELEKTKQDLNKKIEETTGKKLTDAEKKKISDAMDASVDGAKVGAATKNPDGSVTVGTMEVTKDSKGNVKIGDTTISTKSIYGGTAVDTLKHEAQHAGLIADGFYPGGKNGEGIGKGADDTNKKHHSIMGNYPTLDSASSCTSAQQKLLGMGYECQETDKDIGCVGKALGFHNICDVGKPGGPDPGPMTGEGEEMMPLRVGFPGNLGTPCEGILKDSYDLCIFAICLDAPLTECMGEPLCSAGGGGSGMLINLFKSSTGLGVTDPSPIDLIKFPVWMQKQYEQQKFNNKLTSPGVAKPAQGGMQDKKK